MSILEAGITGEHDGPVFVAIPDQGKELVSLLLGELGVAHLGS